MGLAHSFHGFISAVVQLSREISDLVSRLLQVRLKRFAVGSRSGDF